MQTSPATATEIGVAGSCWYNIYKYDDNSYLTRLAVAETRDWSSASTGATVFDFDGDGANEVVFSDESAVYVWLVDDSPDLDPWERMITLLEDTENHGSWTIHEYPLVADVDGDGKAEIIAVNSHLQDDLGEPTEHYGIYVLGSSNDEWVSARPQWNQHACYVTNIKETGEVGYARNYTLLPTISTVFGRRHRNYGSFAASKRLPNYRLSDGVR